MIAKATILALGIAVAPSGASAEQSDAEKCEIIGVTVDFGARALISMFKPGADVNGETLTLALIRAAASPDPMVKRYSDIVDGLRRTYEEACL